MISGNLRGSRSFPGATTQPGRLRYSVGANGGVVFGNLRGSREFSGSPTQPGRLRYFSYKFRSFIIYENVFTLAGLGF